MASKLLFLLCCALSARAQTTARLLTGGYSQQYRITAISNGTPAVVTVADPDNQAHHTMTAGTTVYLQLIQGCKEARGTAGDGYVKIAASPAPTTSTFAIVNLDDSPIACSSPFNGTFESGWVGPYQTVTLNPHPRMNTPQSGAIKDRLIDPDGAGASVAGIVTENGKVWQGLVARYDSTWYTTGCNSAMDGSPGHDPDNPTDRAAVTALCTNEEAKVATSDVAQGWDLLGVALLWQADQSQTKWLNTARYFLNNLDRLGYLGYSVVPPFGCDLTGEDCGLPNRSVIDWISENMGYWARAYDILYPWLSAAERQHFADVALNGWDGTNCTNQLQQQSGTVSVSGAIITGSGFNAIYSPGDHIYVKDIPKWVVSGNWGQILTVTDTQLTLTATSGLNAGTSTDTATIAAGTIALQSQTGLGYVVGNRVRFASAGSPTNYVEGLVTAYTTGKVTINATTVNGAGTFSSWTIQASGLDHYRLSPWSRASNHCGWMWAAGGHEATVGAVDRVGVTTLTLALALSDTSMTVASTADFPTSYPYLLIVDSEVLQVTGGSGLTLNITRGQRYSTAAAHAKARSVFYLKHERGPAPSVYNPYTISGPYEDNRFIEKIAGYISIGTVLAEDSRGRAMLENAWNEYYAIVYPMREDFDSGYNFGGHTDWGYGFGRWQENGMQIGLAGRHAFSPSYPEMLGDYFWRCMMLPLYWSAPGSNFNRGPNSPTGGDAYTAKRGVSWAWIPTATVFNPSTEANWATYWYRNYGMDVSYADASGIREAVWMVYVPPANVGSDWKSVADPWTFTNTSTFAQDRNLAALISRSDWTANAALVMATLGAFEVIDHNIGLSIQNGGPGAVLAHKGSKMLIGGNTASGSGAGSSALASTFAIGTGFRSSSNPWWVKANTGGGGSGGPRGAIDRQKGTSTYVYARGNMNVAWKTANAVTRSYRSVAHLKGAVNYIVVFDDHATCDGTGGCGASHPVTMSANWYYPTLDDAASAATFTLNTGTNSVTFKKPTTAPAMIATKLLFPGAQTVTVGPRVAGTYAIQVPISFGSVTAAQMITIHRLASGTSDTMPPVSLISSDGTSIAAQIDDGDNSWAVIFASDAVDRLTRSATTTFAGNGRLLFTGVTAGIYQVLQDGIPYLAGRVVGDDGTLSFAATGAHLYTLTQDSTPGIFLSLIPTSRSFTCVAGGFAPSNQSIAFTSPGGALDNWSASKSASWLSLSPSSGTTAADFALAVDCSALTAGNYSDTISVSSTTGAVVNTPQTVAVALTAVAAPSVSTTSLPDGVVGRSYVAGLAATGGVGPYTPWSITSGTLCSGLSLSPDGVISGTPASAGSCAVTYQATDSQGNAATKSLSITVAAAAVSITLVPGASSLTFACVGGVTPATQALPFTTTGGSIDQWETLVQSSWLSLTPDSGTAAATITASVNCTGLVPGTYNDTIAIYSNTPDVANSPATVPVALTVTPAPNTGKRTSGTATGQIR